MRDKGKHIPAQLFRWVLKENTTHGKMSHVPALTRLRTAFLRKQELQPSCLQTEQPRRTPEAKEWACSQAGWRSSTSSLALTKQKLHGNKWGEKYPACSSKTNGRRDRESALCGELERKMPNSSGTSCQYCKTAVPAQLWLKSKVPQYYLVWCQGTESDLQTTTRMMEYNQKPNPFCKI